MLARYPRLRETPSADPEQRTRWNVRDSDATLIFARSGSPSPGTELTERLAAEFGRPCLTVEVGDPAGGAEIDGWLRELPEGLVLNVAGPRESEAPGIQAQVRGQLVALGYAGGRISGGASAT